ncbi:MAG: VWA domain-containing protein [Pirellulaceae bacterium]
MSIDISTSSPIPSDAVPVATSKGPSAVDEHMDDLEAIADQAMYEDEDCDDEAFDDEDDDEGWFDDESIAFVASLMAHMGIVLLLALVTFAPHVDPEAIVVFAPPKDLDEDKIHTIEEIVKSEIPQDQIGSNSDSLESAMATATAETMAELAQIPSPIDMKPQDLATIDLNNMFTVATAPVQDIVNKKGSVGQGLNGAKGAVDQLTFEIIQSMEERPTLVVWIFDQSGSLHRQRQEIRDRFDKIYEELGIVEEQGGSSFKRRNASEIPLLTSIVGFGKDVSLLTEDPTDDLKLIKQTVENIEVDSSGVERAFSAVFMAANEFKKFRVNRGSQGPLRNVMLVVVTDERGDDAEGLETTIDLCRRYGMPVYVIGAPAPFGREHSFVKYVDPDPQYDQTPQWGQVDAGPETVLPERVKIGFAGNYLEEPVIDSGFGPFALTRLCYETGGVYYSVHPNRNVNKRVRKQDTEAFSAQIDYFFDSNTMQRYQPDYVAPDEYIRQVRASALRTALTEAAQSASLETLQAPKTRFVKTSDAQLATELADAQKAAAIIEPEMARLAEILAKGQKDRDEEMSPRWQAGFDLAYGRVLAHKVRTETYNAMLAKAKRGMTFEKEKNNTWILEPADEVSVGSKWEREADQAREMLRGVVQDHPGTPWALLAENELKSPIGWKWVERFTDLNPPARNNAGNNNNPPNMTAAQDEQKRMLKKPAPKRPIPKL